MSDKHIMRVVRGFGALMGLVGLTIAAVGVRANSWFPDGKYIVGSWLLILGLIVMIDGATWAIARMSNVDAARRHPREPWLWRPDWAQKTSGRVLRSSKVLWIIAIGYFVMLLPFTLRMVQRGVGGIDYTLFGAGIGIVAWAAARSAIQRKQSGSICRLHNVPFEPGGVAKGMIETAVNEMTGDFNIKLECLQTDEIATEASAAGSRYVTKTVWERSTTVPRASLGRGPRGYSVPFKFEIPDTAEESSSRRLRIRWLMTIKASTPGIDYNEKFELPIFRVT